jgi:phenylacetate-CoA ligase
MKYFFSDMFLVATNLLSLLRSEKWARETIHAYQRRMLVRQLRYAATAVPYYSELGINPATIEDAEALARFPKLTKAIIQTEHQNLCNPAIMSGRIHESLTSGSSGEPTTTFFDARSWLLCKYALKIRRTFVAGTPWRQRLLIFDETSHTDGTIAAPVSRNFLFFRQIRLSVFTPMEEQWAALMQLRPTAIYGSPSGVRELCDYAAKNGLKIPDVPTVFLASELITDSLRKRIEQQFSGRVVGIYGSTEFKEIAHQCEYGRYHINFESVYIESESEGDQTFQRLLITSLVNKAMPLIRFDIGDYAILGHDSCSCGRESPYLTDIVGRETEFLQLADGRRLSPYLLTTAIESTPV